MSNQNNKIAKTVYEQIYPSIQSVNNEILINMNNGVFKSNGTTGYTDKNIVIGDDTILPNTAFEVNGNVNLHGDNIDINTINTNPSIVTIGNNLADVNLNGNIFVNGGPIISGAAFDSTNSIETTLLGGKVTNDLRIDNTTTQLNSINAINNITNDGLNTTIPNSNIRNLLSGNGAIQYNPLLGTIDVAIGTTTNTVAAGNDTRFNLDNTTTTLNNQLILNQYTVNGLNSRIPNSAIRSTLSGNAPITYNNLTGQIGVITGNTAGTVAAGNDIRLQLDNTTIMPNSAKVTNQYTLSGLNSYIDNTDIRTTFNATAPATYNPTTGTIGVSVGNTTGTVAAGDDIRLQLDNITTTLNTIPANTQYTLSGLNVNVKNSDIRNLISADAPISYNNLTGKINAIIGNTSGTLAAGNDIRFQLDNTTTTLGSVPVINQYTGLGLNSRVANNTIRNLLNGLAPIQYNATTGEISVLVGTTAGTVAAGNDPRFNISPNNVVRVSAINLNPSDYTSIKAAVESIPTSGPNQPTINNPWVVLVGPGVYQEVGTIAPPEYIYIVGVSMEACIVKPLNTGYNLFDIQNNTGISFLTIQNVASPNNAVYIHDASYFSLMHKVNIVNCDEAIYCTTTTTDSYVYLEYVSGDTTPTYLLKCDDDGTHFNYVSCENFFTLYHCDDGVLIDGPKTQLLLSGAVFQSGDNLGNAIRCTNGAQIDVRSTYIEDFGKGIIADVNATNSILLLSGILFKGCNINIDIENATVSGNFDGYSAYSKTIINASSSFFITNKDRQIITVANKGADFTSVKQAVDSIIGATATNAYVVSVGPGVFIEDPIILKPYVTLIGSGNLTTVINCNNPSAVAITGVDYSEVSGCTIGGVPNGIGIYHEGSGTMVPFIVKNCGFGDCDTLVKSHGASRMTFTVLLNCQIGGTYNTTEAFKVTNFNETHIINTSIGSNVITSAGLFTPALNGLMVTCDNIPYDTVAIYVDANTMLLFNAFGPVNATASGSVSCIFSVLTALVVNNMLMSDLVFPFPGVIARASGFNTVFVMYNTIIVLTNGAEATGIIIEDGGEGRLYNSSFRGFGIAIQAKNFGIAPFITASALNFEYCGLSMSVEHPLTEGSFTGVTDITKVAIYPDAPFQLVDRVMNRFTVAKSGGDFTSILTATKYLMPDITITTNSGSPIITSNKLFNVRLVGATVTGVGIPLNTTVISYTDRNTITLSNNATLSGTIIARFEISNNLPQMIEVYPGTYQEDDTIILPINTTIKGQDQITTIVEPLNNTDLFELNDTSKVCWLTIQNVNNTKYGSKISDKTNASLVGIYYNNVNNPIYIDVLTKQCNVSLKNITINGSGNNLINITDNGTDIILSVDYQESSINASFTNAILISGNNVNVMMHDNELIGDGSGNGVNLINGASCSINTLFISETNNALITSDNILNNPEFIIAGAVFDNNTVNINIKNRSTTGYYNGFAEYGKTIINPFSSFFILNENRSIITVGKQGSNFTSVFDALQAVNTTIIVNTNTGSPNITSVGLFNASFDGVEVIDTNNTNTIPPATFATFIDENTMLLSNACLNTASINITFKRATTLTPYIIIINPGTYIENQTLVIPENVVVEGQSIKEVVIVPSGNFDMFKLQSFAIIKSLTLSNITGSNYAINVDNVLTTTIQDILIINSTNGINFVNGSLPTSHYVSNTIMFSNNADKFININVGISTTWNIYLDNIVFNNVASGGKALNCISVNGNTSKLFLKNSIFVGDGTGNCINVLNGGYVDIIGCFIKQWNNAIITGDNLPTTPEIVITGCHIEDNINLDVNITNPTTIGHINGYIPYLKIFINSLSPFFVTNKDRNIITVAKRGGDFDTINDALNVITDATINNPYLIQVGPGVFNESPIVMKEYVKLVGSGTNDTIINITNNNTNGITGIDNSEVSNISITGCNGINGVGIYYEGNGSLQTFFLTDVGFRDNKIGIWCNSVSNISTMIATNCFFNDMPSCINVVKLTSTTPHLSQLIMSSCGINTFNCPLMTDAIVSFGAASIFTISNSYIVGDNSNTINGINMYDGSINLITSVEIQGVDTGILSKNIGSGPFIEVANASLVQCNREVIIENSGTSGCLTGCVDIKKVSLYPNVQFSIRDRNPNILIVHNTVFDYTTVNQAIDSINPSIVIQTNNTTTITSPTGSFLPSFNGAEIIAVDIPNGTIITYVDRNTMTLNNAATGNNLQNAQIIRANENNRFTVLIEEGTYTENQIIIPNYTTLQGRSRTGTILTNNTAVSPFIVFGKVCMVQDMDIITDITDTVIFVDNTQFTLTTEASSISNCNISNANVGILCNASLSSTLLNINNITFENVNNGIIIDGTALTSVGKVNVSIYAINQLTTSINTTGIIIKGPNAETFINGYQIDGRTFNGMTGLRIEDGAIINIDSTVITRHGLGGTGYGLYVPSNGAGPHIHVLGMVTHLGGQNIQIDNPFAFGNILSTSQRSRVYINPTSPIVVNYTDALDGSTTISGKIYVGNTNSNTTEITELLKTEPMMGLYEGGIISINSGLTIDISAGVGYLVSGSFPNVILKKIQWNNSSLLLPANTTSYIYYDSSNNLQSNSSQPSDINNIILGRVRTENTTIEFIDASPVNAKHIGNSLDRYNREVFGAIYVSGSIVTANNNRELSISSGNYYFSENEYNPSGASSPATFTEYYHNNSEFELFNGQTIVTNTLYDNQNNVVPLGSITYSTITITTTNGSNVITSTGLFNAQYVDLIISAIGIPNNTVVTNFVDANTINISNNATISGTTTATFLLSNTSITTVNGNNNITSPNALFFSGLVGATIIGSGIPPNTTILTYIDPSNITISNNATLSNTTIATIYNNKFTKHALYTVGDGLNEKYMLVYGQTEFDTLNDAQSGPLPLPPTYFNQGVVIIASIIVERGDDTFTNIISQRPLPSFNASTTASTIFHGSLLGLLNDDHPQYLLVDGTRNMSGDLNLGANDIVNVNLINNVVIQAHASRHLPNGADPLTTASPITLLSATTINAEGTANSFSRSDHTHAILTGTPITIIPDQINSIGVSSNLARADHVHNIVTAQPLSIGSANSIGVLNSFSRSDHIHEGVHSLKANNGTQRFNDIILQQGVGISIVDSPAGTFTIDTQFGPNEYYVSIGSGLTANYTGGKANLYGNIVTNINGSLLLTSSTTNGTIFIDESGNVVQSTISTFSPNAIPLAYYTTNLTNITNITDARTFVNRGVMIGDSNTVLVDTVRGNDTTGRRQGSPFKTITAALSVALSGDVVLVYSGTYDETNLVIPTGVSLSGVDINTTIINTTATTNTTMITMNTNTELQNITLNINSSTSGLLLTGILLSSTSSANCKIRNIQLTINNTTSGASNIYGIRSNGSGNQTNPNIYAINESVIIVQSLNAVSGSIRGILMDSSNVNNLYVKDTNITALTGSGASGIAVETAGISTPFLGIRNGQLIGTTQNYLQTTGTIKLTSTDLTSGTAFNSSSNQLILNNNISINAATSGTATIHTIPTTPTNSTFVTTAGNQLISTGTINITTGPTSITIDTNPSGNANFNSITLNASGNTPSAISLTGTTSFLSSTNDLTIRTTGVSKNILLSSTGSITLTPTISTTLNNATILNSLTANSVLTLNGSKTVTSNVLTNGQLLIGNTGNTPSIANLTGTTNRITITNGAGSITISTPQDIATTSNVTFNSATLSNLSINSIVLTNATKQLQTTTLNNGQLLIGSTGNIPIAATITPTINQTTVSNGSGSITIGTVQDIATTSNVIFNSATLNNLTPFGVVYSDTNNTLQNTILNDGELLIGFTGSNPVANTLTGTNKQIIISKGAGTITLSTPQNIDPTADITFNTIKLNGLTPSASLFIDSTGFIKSSVLTNGQILIGATGIDPIAANIQSVANQTTITNGAGSITIGTVQDINTNSSPTFSSLFLGGSPASISSANNLTLLTTNANQNISLTPTGNLLLQPTNTTSLITIGTTTQTGNITLGQSTDNNTVSINSANNTGIITTNINNGNSSNNNTVNILSGTPTAGTQTVNILTGIATGGTQNVNIATGSASLTLGNINATSTTNIRSGSGGIILGSGSDANPIQIGTLSNSARTINIGTSLQSNTINIGSSLSTNILNGTNTLNNLTANTVLTLNGSKNITSNTLNNGQLLIGSTGNSPVVGNITSTGGTITITNGAGTINLETVIAPSPSTLSVFGTGGDGIVTISVDTVLTRDVYYDTLTLNAGINLTTNGYAIFVKNNCTINGTIRNNGGNGGNATTGTAGTAGIGALSGTLGGGSNGAAGRVTNGNGNNGNNLVYAGGNNGGNGGASGANIGGIGGIATVPPAAEGGIEYFNFNTNAFTRLRSLNSTRLNGGAGGGSGARNNGTTASGGGGGGAGVILLVAKTLTGSGSITTIGGNAGASASAGNAIGGSGGGGGGYIYIISQTNISATSITTNVSGGIASSGLNGGANGVNGASGQVIQLLV